MRNKYSSEITLFIKGPFLTATVSDTYGINKTFHRNYEGNFAILASHIKGKLRMALEELEQSINQQTFTKMFGSPTEKGSYNPETGDLEFSDFILQKSHQIENSNTRTRITIDTITSTAQENKLWIAEDSFSTNQDIMFTGKISFFASDNRQANEIAGIIWIGFRWLTTLGSSKGIGFGRLHKVQMATPKPIVKPNISKDILESTSPTIHIRITPQEPILIGGIKKPRTNFIRSERIITGSIIKGALATALNKAYEATSDYGPLSQINVSRYPEIKDLIENFARIRISHAFPVIKGNSRPNKIPLSCVRRDKEEPVDTIFFTSDAQLIDNDAPIYAVDWKHQQYFSEEAIPSEIFITRTKINNNTRRSEEENLFTYSYICPYDDDGKSIDWVCNIDFSNISDMKVRQNTKNLFIQSIYKYLDRLGKKGTRINIEVHDGLSYSPYNPVPLSTDGQILVIALQTDTIILSPHDVRSLQPSEDLLNLYKAYWQEISGDTLELIDFYAQQTFQGGYLYHRYLGESERKSKPNKYRPYYLTCAGSVFKLRIKESSQGINQLREQWIHCGLPLPQWAESEYSSDNREIWQNCPFVPENGYGEILIYSNH